MSVSDVITTKSLNSGNLRDVLLSLEKVYAQERIQTINSDTVKGIRYSFFNFFFSLFIFSFWYYYWYQKAGAVGKLKS